MISPTAHYLDLVSGRKRGFFASAQRAVLRAASWPYAWASAVRNRLYDAGWKRIASAGVPVVSIGNLTVGGTGKTPCSEYVARHYWQRDLRVTILSRGYGAGDGPNDEALVLEENLPDVPHLQGADRAALARLAVEELESELLVLDDGFQHRRLARALDVVLIDATQPWDHGYLFPRGLLRESPRSLRRADAVVLTRCDLVAAAALADMRQGVARFAPAALVIETVHRPLSFRNFEGAEVPLTSLRERPAAAFCGIGNPESFRRTLERLGVNVRRFCTFPDHHAFRRADVEGLEGWAQELPEDGVVLTTQKDLVKLRVARLGGRELWALRIGFHIQEGEDSFQHLLDRVVNGLHGRSLRSARTEAQA